MKINAEDSGFIEYILIQLPEVIAEKKTNAFIAGYRRLQDLAGTLDIGFKVFELEKLSLKKWNTEPEDLVDMLGSIQDNLEPGSTEDDLVFEIMLKQGLELTLPIEKFIVGEATV